MLAVTGLHADDNDPGWVIHRPRIHDRDFQDPGKIPTAAGAPPPATSGAVKAKSGAVSGAEGRRSFKERIRQVGCWAKAP